MKYAIVRILDEKGVLLDDLQRRYLRKAMSIKEWSTMRCSEIPALKTFSQFIKERSLSPLASDFGPKQADEFAVWCAGKFKSAYTVCRKLATVKSLFEYAIVMEDLAANPFERIEPPETKSVGRYLSDFELGKFLGMLPQRVRWAYEFSLYTGLRRAEVLAMRPSWVKGSYMTIPGEVTKSGDARVVVLGRNALSILRSITAFRRALGESVEASFLGYGAWVINDNGTSAWKRLGHGRIRFHDMRHNWATRFFELTHDIRALMDQGGWKSLSSVMIYQHMTPERRAGNLQVRYRF